MERCLQLKASKAWAALGREMENRGYENFSPTQRPEWLLLQLQGNLLIRPVQVRVAEHMMAPPDGLNIATQLNMGEGKTTVILPMLCATLPSPPERFVRLTVLRSLFRTNLDQLSFQLGGLLRRRVYSFPCRRDAVIGPKQAELQLAVYREGLAQRGVVVTLPEHRFSFQLKALESCQKRVEGARELLEMGAWVDEHARDLLDESDALLDGKYQLVYRIPSKNL
jgi:hypothetical protein